MVGKRHFVRFEKFGGRGFGGVVDFAHGEILAAWMVGRVQCLQAFAGDVGVDLRG